MDKRWFGGFFKKSAAQKLSRSQIGANEGDPASQFALGLELELVANGDQEMAEAVKWYRKASDQHHSTAQYHLALLYAKGSGVTEDKATSAALMLESANGGNADAQFAMGILFYRRSVSDTSADEVECRIEGYKWFSLSSGQKREGATAYCETITRKMSREDVQTAIGRVQQFTPRAA